MSSKNESPNHKKVRLAIVAIEKGKPKDPKNKTLTLSSVAREASVSRALIQRDMPDLYKRVMGKSGLEQAKARIKTLRAKLIEEESKRKEREEEIAELREMLANTASVNATLMRENKELRVRLGLTDNVTPLFT
ncbi:MULTISPECIES: TetR family transcriptional regulator [Vibrio harveyi group]|uniref:TetR family transcriptional regulator n=1 Tax=Vibrio harveyi group TaxID=717610 RepID=UPI0011228AC8|nr:MULTISPECIES: TetR family transcriptional regulator [Vibrio harveyi group]MCR9965457.1 TetR family transcriptional regulator [Vibrio antiquarius]TOK63672.1 TetR family transcriptional regulator [Vibrio parahaemolyticus]TOK79146.1 TetR family transcriptional regulator [Vibrio parahaemolyticus]TOK85886.1 TetR family transcriptional regulator [Vibrio parahaemolyticus]